MLARSLVVLSAVLLACAHAGQAAPAAAKSSADAARAPSERILFVDGAAGRLRVSDGGSGEPAVVFVHGLGGDLEAWRAQLDHLRPYRRAIAYDQRGHGQSDRAKDGVYTVDALAEDLDAVVKALGVQRFYLVGHSFSGTVITAYAAAHPERLAGLVYVDAVGDFGSLGREDVAQSFAKELLPAYGAAERRAAFEAGLAPPARPATRERVLATLDRLDQPAFGRLRQSMAYFPGKDRFVRYGGPALAIEMEGAVPPFRASAALGVRRVDVPGVSHWVMMDDPEAFDRALDPFLGIAPAR